MSTPVFLLFGAPGSGKGTQSQLLVETMGLTHVSTGSVLRQQMATTNWVEANPALADSIQTCFDAGALVDDATMLGVVASLLRQPAAGYILDGFPRTLYQAEQLWEVLNVNGCELRAALHLDVDAEACARRLHQRQDNRPEDQNAELVLARLRIYNENTAPLIGYYQESGHYRRVNADATPAGVHLGVLSAVLA